MNSDTKELVNHISRLEGQLASVKSELIKHDVDCLRASTTLLSAARSFAGLRQKFTEAFLRKHFVGNIAARDTEKFEKLIALIRG